MKLLVLTQKVDRRDDVLGFFHGWLAALAGRSEQVIVICLQKGECRLPANVRVFSLGKETGVSRLKYLSNFYKYIWRQRPNYDCVWVHMNTVYVLLGGWLWRLLGKKVILWYAHGRVSWDLRLAVFLSHRVVTSTASGCRLASKKIHVIGQGIDTNEFTRKNFSHEPGKPFTIVSIGRISPSKDYETLLRALRILPERPLDLVVYIIGDLGRPEQKEYWQRLNKLTAELELGKIVHFLGSVPHQQIKPYLRAADLFVNLGRTGSLDKAILEAAACGLPIVSCNEAIAQELKHDARFIFSPGAAEELARKIAWYFELYKKDHGQLQPIGQELRQFVVKRHNLDQFITRLVSNLLA